MIATYAAKTLTLHDQHYKFSYTNDTLLLTVLDPTERYVKINLLNNDDVINSHTTYLQDEDKYNTGQCIEKCDRVTGPTHEVTHVEVIKGPGVYKEGKNSYKVVINPCRKSGKYKFGFKTERSYENTFHGFVLIGKFNSTWEKKVWIDRDGLYYQAYSTKDRIFLRMRMCDDKVIFYEQKGAIYKDETFVLYSIRSKAKAVRVRVIFDNNCSGAKNRCLLKPSCDADIPLTEGLNTTAATSTKEYTAACNISEFNNKTHSGAPGSVASSELLGVLISLGIVLVSLY